MARDNAIGMSAVAAAGVLFVGSMLLLKDFKQVGLVHQLSLYALALFLPAAATAGYYAGRPRRGAPFRAAELFTNADRLVVGLTNLAYILCAYTAFKLLPMSYAFPLLYLYPVFYLALSAAINKTPVGARGAPVYAVTTLGILIMVYQGYRLQARASASVVAGSVLMLVAALFSALYFVFVRTVPSRAVLTRSTAQVLEEDKGRDKTHVAAIQLLESITVPLIVFLALSATLAGLSARGWRGLRVRSPVLQVVLDARTGTKGDVLKLFAGYLFLSFGCTVGSIVADNYLSPGLFTGTDYIVYVGLGTLVGVWMRKEAFPAWSKAGLFLVVAASVAGMVAGVGRAKKSAVGGKEEHGVREKA